MNKQDMSGQVALVTGASTGIGRAAAVALAECGANVAINYFRNHDGAEETRRIVSSLGRKAVAIGADVSTREGVKNLVDTVRSELGSIDILVNNAGESDPSVER